MEEIARGPIAIGPEDDRHWGRLAWWFVGLGLALRISFYALDFPLWWDEAFVAVNLLRRGYLELLRPLDYGQVCPLLFLWAELAMVKLLGFSEWSLRLFPLVCSLASVVLFRVAAGWVVRGPALVLAVGVLAASVHPIKHAADLKPYATDLLVGLVLQSLAIRWWRQPLKAGALWGLAAFAPVALMASHPSAFVAGGVALALAWPVWRSRRWDVRLAFAAFGLAMVGTSAGLYLAFTKAQASSASPGMRAMWESSFPPLDSVFRLARWLVVVHSGDLMALPCGGERGASVLSLAACVVGGVVFWLRGRLVILGCLLAPLGVGLVAAGLRLYPYGGPAPHGSAARVMQYAAPGLCLLIGLGLARILGWFRSEMARSRAFRLACLGLVAVGLVPLVEGWRRPYRAYQAQAAREFARRFWPEVGDGAEVACLRWDFGVAEWDSIRLGVAVSVCDQAIYSPSRRAGGPELGAVSAARPLRCVLGLAPEGDGPKLKAWLDVMRKDYFLKRRQSIAVDVAEPGRRPVVERYEVFEFVPREFQSVKGS